MYELSLHTQMFQTAKLVYNAAKTYFNYQMVELSMVIKWLYDLLSRNILTFYRSLLINNSIILQLSQHNDPKIGTGHCILNIKEVEVSYQTYF